MKGHRPHELAPFFQLHVAADDIDHVDARKQLLDERLGMDTGDFSQPLARALSSASGRFVVIRGY